MSCVHRNSVKEIFECKNISGSTADDSDQEVPLTFNEDGGYKADYDDEVEVEGTIRAGPGTTYSIEACPSSSSREKIGVHYERFAKRTDVKKLKGSV